MAFCFYVKKWCKHTNDIPHQFYVKNPEMIYFKITLRLNLLGLSSDISKSKTKYRMTKIKNDLGLTKRTIFTEVLALDHKMTH